MINRIMVLGVVSQNAAREARLVSDFLAIVLICMYPFPLFIFFPVLLKNKNNWYIELYKFKMYSVTI